MFSLPAIGQEAHAVLNSRDSLGIYGRGRGKLSRWLYEGVGN